HLAFLEWERPRERIAEGPQPVAVLEIVEEGAGDGEAGDGIVEYRRPEHEAVVYTVFDEDRRVSADDVIVRVLIVGVRRRRREVEDVVELVRVLRECQRGHLVELRHELRGGFFRRDGHIRRRRFAAPDDGEATLPT